MIRHASILAVLTLTVVATMSSAAPRDGKGYAVKTVQAGQTMIFYETFMGAGLAQVSLVGDGTTDLDIYVYDEFNNLIVRGIGPTDIELVHLRPFYTTRFRIEVRNLGTTWNRFTLVTH